MSKELTAFEIKQALDNAAMREFNQSSGEASRTSNIQRQAHVLMESAADNPIAMTIFARTVIRGESYQQAVQFVNAHVTNRKISNGAARVLVYRMKRAISGE